MIFRVRVAEVHHDEVIEVEAIDAGEAVARARAAAEAHGTIDPRAFEVRSVMDPGERERIRMALLGFMQSLEASTDCGCWELLGPIVDAIGDGVFSEPGPYLQVAKGEDPPPGWVRVSGAFSAGWVRKQKG